MKIRENTRTHQRFNVCLKASLKDGSEPHKVRITSLGIGGCTVRTSRHLKPGEGILLRVPVWVDKNVVTVVASAKVVWGKNDYCIDTLYRYGLKFEKDLDESELKRLVEEKNQVLIPFKTVA
ncbi:MAG: PilZ domain-containing protein [Bdellovibrionota bacterium]